MKKALSPLLTLNSNSIFQIPIHFTNEQKVSYLNQLKIHFSHIDTFLKNSKTSDFMPIIKKEFCEKVSGFHHAIINIVNQYLNGHPSLAYELFEKALGDYNIGNEVISSIQVQIPQNSYFFRTKRNDTSIGSKSSALNYVTNMQSSLDLFHIPFQSRRSVPSNRFSISGYPSLYISENLQTSYSESFPNDESGPFHVIGFKNIRPLYFIDLSQRSLSPNNLLFEGILPKGRKSSTYDIAGLFNNFGAYQLILACHTKIQYEGEKIFFKAEYIIPQLLLQWLKQQRIAIDGIRYSSCTGLNKYPHAKKHYNYILPVSQSLQKGYCPSLLSLFSSSDVFSYFYDGKISSKRLQKIQSDIINSSFKTLI